MYRKKRIAGSLLLALLISAAPAIHGQEAAPAAGTETGTCGDNLTWTLKDGILVIEGTGDMPSYPGFEDRTDICSVVIREGVSFVGNGAFENCIALTSVTLPDSVTGIGNHAFENCTSLTDLSLPVSVSEIGTGAFMNCSALTTLTLPENLTRIGSYAFFDCTSLTELSYPGSACRFYQDFPELYDELFDLLYFTEEHSYDKPIFLPIQNHGICRYTCSTCGEMLDFSYTRKSKQIRITGSSYRLPRILRIPEQIENLPVTSIGENAFSYCSRLSQVTIPDSVTAIENSSFDHCDGLSRISFSQNLETIGSYAFNDCTSLTDIVLPPSCTEIGEYAFADCSSLTDITLESEHTTIGMDALGMVYSPAQNAYISLPEITLHGLSFSEFEAYAKAHDLDYDITVHGTPGRILLNISMYIRKLGDPPFTVSAEVEEGYRLYYESSDPSILTVDENGQITLLSEGTALVTLYTRDEDTLEVLNSETVHISVQAP